MPIAPDRLLYTDDHLLIVQKLAGELVVKGSGAVQKLPLYDFLKKDYPEITPINRLDFETSGIVVFTRSKPAYEAARAQMDSWKKVYRTLVKGNIKHRTGTIKKPLPARNSKADIPATTRYTVLEHLLVCDYVECEIQTGRHHQIRKHFAGIYHPLVLDDVYGDKKFNSIFAQRFRLRKFFLHAQFLEMQHPITGEDLRIEAPLPKPFVSILNKLS